MQYVVTKYSCKPVSIYKVHIKYKILDLLLLIDLTVGSIINPLFYQSYILYILYPIFFLSRIPIFLFIPYPPFPLTLNRSEKRIEEIEKGISESNFLQFVSLFTKIINNLHPVPYNNDKHPRFIIHQLNKMYTPYLLGMRPSFS